MQKRLQLLIAMLVLVVSVAMAQVTTSGISGKVTSQGEEVIGATVTSSWLSLSHWTSMPEG